MSSPARGAADAEASSTKRPQEDAPADLPSQKRNKGKEVAHDTPEPDDDKDSQSPEHSDKGNSSAAPQADAQPPLPDGEPPAEERVDDGWAPVWDATAGAYYFYNRFTQATQWENPRVPEATAIPTAPDVAPGLAPGVTGAPPLPADAAPPGPVAGGYDPAIHGDYDENAWYAQTAQPEVSEAAPIDPAAAYVQTGAFNRFTGRWQAADLTPERFNDENKSKRQMNAFFDVDLAANSHDGKSLRAERANKKLTKSEVKQFKQKRKAKKEEKRRAWLLD